MERRQFLIDASSNTIDCTLQCGVGGIYSFARVKTIEGIRCRGCIAPFTYLVGESKPQNYDVTVEDNIRACEYWNSLLGVDISSLIYPSRKSE